MCLALRGRGSIHTASTTAQAPWTEIVAAQLSAKQRLTDQAVVSIMIYCLQPKSED